MSFWLVNGDHVLVVILVSFTYVATLVVGRDGCAEVEEAEPAVGDGCKEVVEGVGEERNGGDCFG